MTNSKRVMRDLEEFIAERSVVVTQSVATELRKQTPKDTEWASLNWRPTIGQPADDPAVAFVSVQERSIRLSAAQGRRSEFSSELKSIESFKDLRFNLWIANTVAYIGDLNSGSSRKAPAGFVQSSLKTGIAQALRKR